MVNFSLIAQTLTGKVTSTENETLPGVSVTIKNTTRGAITDANGKYTIAVNGGETVVFSYIGFKPFEVKIGDQTKLDVQLSVDEAALEEVVVVGYGALRKEAVTGSVVSISGDQIREVPSPNLTQAMQGRMAGVEISQTSTRPGATMQIRIRGTRSLSADNNPLVVLDGIPFPGSFADINPNDIKSVDVLKDASATAIYGSRGANGVILITTDKGQKELSLESLTPPTMALKKYLQNIQ